MLVEMCACILGIGCLVLIGLLHLAHVDLEYLRRRVAELEGGGGDG